LEAVFAPINLIKMATGAVRDADGEAQRFDLVCPTALRELAATYAEGAAKYGDFNWTKGMPIGQTINRTLRHLNMWLAGDRSEPHLPHAAWGIFAVIHFTEHCQHHQIAQRRESDNDQHTQGRKGDEVNPRRSKR
jgi:hypothetical protein